MATFDRAELAAAIQESAARLGINPSDLATAISYETKGSFDPWIAGPTTQWGLHRGLIQMGETQRKRYGYTEESPLSEKFGAIEQYLKDAGVKPGMGLLDVYSAINAGRVGLYNRSDAHNGGVPGTVADKVASMVGHRARANALLEGQAFDPPAGGTKPSSSTGTRVAGISPGITAAMQTQGDSAAGGSMSDLMQMMQRIPGMMQDQRQQVPAMMQFATPQGLARARALARAAAMRSISGAA